MDYSGQLLPNIFWRIAFKKVVSLESNIALLKQKAYKNLETLVEAWVILEISVSGKWYFIILKKFEVRKNSHNMNVFTIWKWDMNIFNMNIQRPGRHQSIVWINQHIPLAK